MLKARAFIKTGLYESAGNELEKISGEGVGKEYYLLKSYVNFHYGDFENALKILTENLREEGNDITQKILTNILQINSGNLNSFENLNEFKLDGENKKYVQILNGICNFENNQYHSAKYRFSNLNDLTAEQVNLIKPIIEYTNSKIAD